MVNFNATQNILRQYANSYRLKDIFSLSISKFKKTLYSPNKVQISLVFFYSNRKKTRYNVDRIDGKFFKDSRVEYRLFNILTEYKHSI